jgi:glycogen debranching enzyme
MATNTTTTHEFFLEIAQRRHFPSMQGFSGTCQFIIDGAGAWHVDIQDGNVTVSEQNKPSDATYKSDVAIFDQIVQGKANGMVLFMQNKVQVDGNPALLYLVQRLFPPPIARERSAPPTPSHPDKPGESIIVAEKNGQQPHHKEPPSQSVSILEGNTFVVSDLSGDIDASPTDTYGLFSWDTRFLSRWLLTINGISPRPLSTDDLQYYAVQFFLVPTTGTIYVDSKLSVIRTREVEKGFLETITILNHANQDIELDVGLDVGSDFADAFEVKDGLPKQGSYYTRVEGQRLILGYQRELFNRETWIETSEPAQIDEQSIRYHIHIPSHGQWTTDLSVITASAGLEEKYTQVHSSKHAMQQNLAEWIEKAPKLTSNWKELERIYQRSLIDLAALRFYPKMTPGDALPAAGLPWFMTIFGRDSIITGLQSLPFTPELAETTLRVLAIRQGVIIDDFRDEEPGKIIHEVRFGEMTAFEERPHSPYYGAADVTPLFLILLDEVERWTGNIQLVQRLEWTARAALEWIDKYGDRNGDGYVEYSRRNTRTGIENQCWKDSWDSILFADGSQSKLPRATCEIQGYVYDAKRRCARLAREIWHDIPLADRLEQEAADLKRRFNQDYWLNDRGYFALAIDGDGRKVDALTSNIGHLLWSGIVDEDKAAMCVHHLMSDRLFTGWGIRTMAEGDGGYNPIGYHVGTVWPHDNAFIAQGLARYGYKQEAGQIAMGILQAATYFRHRLPEAFAGYARTLTDYPVEYPTACSPQAWSTGAPLLLLRMLMGLEPIGENLLVNPALPHGIGWIGIFDVPGRWGHMDAFARSKDNEDFDTESDHLLAIRR